MNSSVTRYVGLGLFALVIFVVTLVSQFAGSPPAGPAATGGGEADLGEPLRFTDTKMYFDPESESQGHRAFPGFYEKGEQLHVASFWFQNPHPKPVKVTVRGRSCAACTSARIAVLPSATGEVVARLSPDLAPVAAVTGCSPAAVASDGLLTGLKWETLDFAHPDEIHEIPAAAADGTPTVGVFQMLFKVVAVGPKTLNAWLGMAVADQPGITMQFDVSFLGMPAFDVRPNAIALGDVPEGASPRSVELIAWSATRKTDGSDPPFPPPTVAIAPNDQFVQAATPTPLSESDLVQLTALLRAEGKSGRVAGAYRVPVTVYRRLPADQVAAGRQPEPDIGPFERQLGFIVPGTDPVTVTVTGTVSGLVTVLEKGLVDLGSFASKSGTEKTVELASDRNGLELTVLAGECVPKYLVATLTDRPGTGGRRLWGLNVKVPPGECLADLPADAAVVLQAKVDGAVQKVKVPVKGRGFIK